MRVAGTLRRITVLACIWLAANAALAGAPPQARPETIGFSAQRLEAIDRFYADKVRKGELAGIVLLVARHGKIAHFSATGFADIAKGTKMETGSIFRFYSMTKPIAAVALMSLYEQGRFQLDDPISKYIPEFAKLRVLKTPDAAIGDTVAPLREPTIHDLFRHTAGFSHALDPGGDKLDAAYVQANVLALDIPLSEMMARLAKLPLRNQPGTRFEYSIAPDVEARLVEILSGMPFETFLQQRLFTPLRMKDTGFRLAPDQLARLAKIHWSKNGKLVPADDAHGYPNTGTPVVDAASINSYSQNNARKGGAYGLAGTAEDYWRFAQMLLDGGQLGGARILSPSTVDYITRDHLSPVVIPDQSGNPSGVGWGLGMAVMKNSAAAGYMSSEGTTFWHGIAATTFWIDPRKDMVVVALTQHLQAPQAELSVLIPEIRALVYGALIE